MRAEFKSERDARRSRSMSRIKVASSSGGTGFPRLPRSDFQIPLLGYTEGAQTGIKIRAMLAAANGRHSLRRRELNPREKMPLPNGTELTSGHTLVVF